MVELANLAAGNSLTVIKEFIDFDGALWNVDDKLLNYHSHEYVVYDDFYIFHFASLQLRLGAESDVLKFPSRYLAVLPR